MSAITENANGITRREPIPGYVLTERLGSGGYGEVWKADAPGGLKKAVKIVFGAVNDVRATRELKALERIRDVNHPMLLTLERIEAVDDHLVVVTELADMSMRDCYEQHAANGRMGIPRQELLGYLRDAADGLDFLYERHSLQHLDVKPENLLLVGGRVKVADFGMIKDLHDNCMSIVAGVTPLYAPPELFDGQPNRHSDQYSLAVLYQEMLTGQPPFEGRTPAQIAFQQLQGTPVLSPLPRLDQPVVARALAKNPDQRFPNCRTFVDQLIEASKGNQRSACPGAITIRPRKANADSLSELHGTVSLGPAPEEQAPSPIMCNSEIAVMAPREIQQREGMLRPTLVVGLGGTGNKLLAEIRRRLKDQWGDTARVPCIRFLAMDTDSDDLHHDARREQIDWNLGEAVAMPLRSASEYREWREPLLEWLHRRWLYNIPRSQQTEGIRPLGRLAFVDHYAEIRQKLAHALHGMMAEDAVQTSVASTAWSVDVNQPEVLLLGNVAGGTAGGALLDLIFTIRSELNKLQRADRLRLFLLHCTNRRSRHRDLAMANTTIFLKEFADIVGPQGRYPGEPTCGIPAFESAGSQFSEASFVHLGDELDDEAYLGQLQLFADFLTRQICSPCAETIRRFQEECREVDGLADYATLESVGVSSVASLFGKLPQHFASQVASNLLESWISPHVNSHDFRRRQVAPGKGMIVLLDAALDDRTLEQRAVGLLSDRQLDADGILNLSRKSFSTKLPALNLMAEPGALNQLDKHLEQLSGELADRQAHSLMETLAQTLNSPGNCVYAAILMASVLRRKLNELADQLEANWERVNQSIAISPPDRSAPASPRPTVHSRAESSSSQPTAIDRMRYHQSWCELRGAHHLVRSISTRVAAMSDQFLELARQIRQIRAAWTKDRSWDENGAADGGLIEWGQTQMVTWVQSLDKESKGQLALTGASLPSLLGQPPNNVSRLLDQLRHVACRIVEPALLHHSLHHSTQAQEPGTTVEPLQRLLDHAVPVLTMCGGRQRWGMVVSPGATSLRNGIQQKIRQATGLPGYEIEDPTGNLLICCHLSQVPVDNCIRTMIGTRRELIPLAERLHARNDLSWSPIV